MISYAQNFEDVLLHRALREVEKGRYIDIGAQDPVVDSVSLAFYEAGWRGIHVEPTPAYTARLREARPDEMVIEAAVSDMPGPIRFYQFPETGLSTGKDKIAKVHESAGHAFEEIVVPCIRLDELLELSSSEIHWMKIDVEGMEADVLRSWGASERRPWVLVIESTVPNTQERTDGLWIDEVLRRGYESVFFDGLSRYFLHESHRGLADRFEAPANVFDAFVVAPHHFSATQMRAQHEATTQRLDQEWARAEELTARLHESWHARDVAREEQKNALERLAAANLDHRTALERHVEALQAAEERHREREDLLRRNADEAQAAAARDRAEAARLEERVAQLQQRLERAEKRHREASAEMARSQIDLAEARSLLQLTQSNAERDAAEARSTIARVEQERNEGLESARRLRADLEAEIRGLQASLTKANALIAAAAAQTPGRWQRIGEALGFVRPGPWLPALADWQASSARNSPTSQSSSEASTRKPTSSMNDAQPVAPRNPYLRANSLGELLSWDDVDFVRCAYVTVLGRQPDVQGEAHYTDWLRRGRSKMEVLWNLRRSFEARRHDPGIAGLDRALKRSRWKRYPLVGAFVRSPGNINGAARSGPLWANEDLSGVEHRLASLSAKIDQMQQSLSLIEGSLLRSSERSENLLPLDPESFARRLAIAGRSFEGTR